MGFCVKLHPYLAEKCSEKSSDYAATFCKTLFKEKAGAFTSMGYTMSTNIYTPTTSMSKGSKDQACTTVYSGVPEIFSNKNYS